MTRRGGVPWARPFIAALVLWAGACASKPAPAVVTAPAFPEYGFPPVPAELANPRASAAHQAAWNLFQAGDAAAAEKRWTGILRDAPGFAPAATGLGYLDLSRRDFEAAVARFDQALGGLATYAPALIGRADALLGAGRVSDAIAAFEAVLAVQPEASDIRQRLDVLRLRSLQDQIALGERADREGRLDAARAAYRGALQASPESAYLHRLLGDVERRSGNLADAEAEARLAIKFDDTDAAAHVLLAECLLARGELQPGIEALERARALDPGLDLEARLAALRVRLAESRLPAQYRGIPEAPRLTRGQLASLVGIRLRAVVELAGSSRRVVMTDVRGHWAAPWILTTTEHGAMDPFPNHTFQPDTLVTRSELAEVTSRLLRVIGARDADVANEWRQAVQFADLDPGHLFYEPASMAVASHVMAPLPDASFQPSRLVTGAEATAAVDRLSALAARAGIVERPPRGR